MSSEFKQAQKAFNKLLKKYGTTLNVHYGTKDQFGKMTLAGSYLNIKVLIDPLGVGLNFEGMQYANIKTAKAVFYIPFTYKINGVDTTISFKDESGKQYPFINFVLPDGFSYSIVAIAPGAMIGNNSLCQVGVQQ